MPVLLSRVRVVLAPVVITEVLVPVPIMAQAPVVITEVLVPVPIMALAPGSIVDLARGASSAGVVEPSIPITAAAGTVTWGRTPMAMPATIRAMPRRRS